jgi:hypothetical protein
LAKHFVGAVGLGIVLGALGSRMLFLGWATLIAWAVAAVGIGIMSRAWREALIDGAAYGFALGFSFTALGYNGADPPITKLPFFAILGIVSAAFGAALTLVAQWLAARSRSRSGGGAG